MYILRGGLPLVVMVCCVQSVVVVELVALVKYMCMCIILTGPC